MSTSRHTASKEVLDRRRYIAVWDLGSRRKLLSLEGHKDHAFSVQISPDGKTLASASKDGTVRLWDLTAAKP